MNFGIKQLGWGRQSSGHAGLTVELSQDDQEAEILPTYRYGSGKGAPQCHLWPLCGQTHHWLSHRPHMHPTLSCR